MRSNVWTEHKDKDGRLFYYNRETKKSTWKRPVELDSNVEEKEQNEETSTHEEVWEQRLDPKSKRMYYFNRASRKSTWIQPTNATIKPYVSKSSTVAVVATNFKKGKSENEETSQEGLAQADELTKASTTDPPRKGKRTLNNKKKVEEGFDKSFIQRDSDDRNGEEEILSNPESLLATTGHKRRRQLTANEEPKKPSRQNVEGTSSSPVLPQQTQFDERQEWTGMNVEVETIAEVYDEKKKEKEKHVSLVSPTVLKDTLVTSSTSISKEGTESTMKNLQDTGEAQEIHALLAVLNKKDSIMEVDVIQTIESFLRTYQDASGPEILVQTLANNYRGYAQMIRLVSGWLDESFSAHPDISAAAAIVEDEKESQVTSRDIIFDLIKSLIIQRYQPNLMKRVMDAAVEPAWLEQMLEESPWRLMLIELADKHKTCGVLNYALQRISEAGHHKEIASITNASAFFSVFTGVFQDALQRLPCDPRDEVMSDIQALRKISSQNAYTYMYTQELLHQFEHLAQNKLNTHRNNSLNRNGNEIGNDKMNGVGIGNIHGVRKVLEKYKRIRQEIHQATHQNQGAILQTFHILKRKDLFNRYPILCETLLVMIGEGKCSLESIHRLYALYYYSASSSPPPVAHLRNFTILSMLVNALFNPFLLVEEEEHRERCLYLLAYAVCALDERTAYDTLAKEDREGLINTGDLQETRHALAAAHKICQSDHTLGFNIHQSGRVEELISLMHVPVVAMGVLHWIEAAISNVKFKSSSLFHVCFPALIQLIRVSIDQHPLQWPRAFDMLVLALNVQNEMDAIKMLDLKQEVLNTMVYMMTCGYVFPVLRYIHAHANDLDQALLRNFLAALLDRISPPYSKPFMDEFLLLLSRLKVQWALKTSNEKTKKQVLGLIKVVLKKTDPSQSPSHQGMMALQQLKNLFVSTAPQKPF